MKICICMCMLGCLVAGCTPLPQPLTLNEFTPLPTPAGRMVGWVFVDANGNDNLDTGELLLSGIAVEARMAEQTLTQTTVSGWFGFGGLADGAWFVTADAPGYACAEQSATVAGSKLTVNVPCLLASLPTETPTVALTVTPTFTPPNSPTATPTGAALSPWQVEPLTGDCFRLRHSAFAGTYRICITTWPQVNVFAEQGGE
jgi:hypothetical protein